MANQPDILSQLSRLNDQIAATQASMLHVANAGQTRSGTLDAMLMLFKDLRRERAELIVALDVSGAKAHEPVGELHAIAHVEGLLAGV